MVFDDVVIGSGLAALGVAFGLPPERRVLVLNGGDGASRIDRYAGAAIPCSRLGPGGLGAFWHGVIPAGRTFGDEAGVDDFWELFEAFYPGTARPPSGAGEWLFVPYHPIRPASWWPRIESGRRNRLRRIDDSAVSIDRHADGWTVATATARYAAARIWLAAGTLGTAAVLERSPPFAHCVRPRVSDHVIVYLGQIDRRAHPSTPLPRVVRRRRGFWLGAADVAGDVLVTTKPARFDYAVLDHGIEQRSAFGLPAAGVLAKVARARSIGLVAESLFNKFGLWPRARRLSVYGQARVADAYARRADGAGLDAADARLTERIAAVRASLAHRAPAQIDGMRPSRRPDLYVPGIHVHGSVDADAWRAVGADGIAIVDASAIADIGVVHHSFGTMTMAYVRARRSA